MLSTGIHTTECLGHREVKGITRMSGHGNSAEFNAVIVWSPHHIDVEICV